MSVKLKKILSFNFPKGKVLAGNYQVVQMLGKGLEGEVYLVNEVHTNVIRAVKIFYPHRNPKFSKSKQFIKTLTKLDHCSVVMNYHGFYIIKVKDHKVACVVCEFIEGDTLSDVVDRQKRKRFGHFESLHLLYALVKGLETIHRAGEYHGDLHLDNILIRKFGLSFDIKIIDFLHWGDSKKDNRDEDIIKTIRIFYDVLGGQKVYSKLPYPIKYIIKGLKRGNILQEFKTMTHLRSHLESLEWDHEF